MDALKKKLRVAKLNTARIRDQMSEVATGTMDIEKLSKLESLLTEFRSCKKNFDQVSEEILLSIEETDAYENTAKPYIKDMASIRDILHTYEAKVRTFHKKLSADSNRDSLLPNSDLNQSFRQPNQCVPKLERIQVPTFDGNILNFPNFKGLFQNLVHGNEELSNVQKLYYLKQSLVGTAREVIRDFELNDAAYPEAWAYILKRYENKRAVIRTLFRNFSNLEPIKHESSIRSLLDQTDIVIRSLKANGETINDTFSRFIAYHISSRLDSQTLKDWENSVKSCDAYPKFDELQSFLQIRSFVSEEKVERGDKNDKSKQPAKKSFAIAKNSCISCKDNHLLIRCAVFAAKTPKQRLELIQQNQRCANCFAASHSTKQCTSSHLCKVCNRKHHTLLHLTDNQSPPAKQQPTPTPQAPPAETSQPENLSSTASVHVIHKSEKNSKVVLLPTAVVRVLSKKFAQPARALLDSCSQVTMISEEYVKRNHIPVKPTNDNYVRGIASQSLSLNHSTSISILSRYDQSEMIIDACIVPQSALSYTVPGLQISKNSIQQFRNFDLADPAYYVSPIEQPKIDMLIGADYFEDCFLDERTTIDTLTLRSSKFGWVISGTVQTTFSYFIASNTIENPVYNFATFEIEHQLRKFWELEEVKPVHQNQTDEKIQCVKHFEETYTRDPNGQFVVRLPFRDPPVKLNENRDLAYRNLRRTEKSRPAEIRNDYIAFMREYEQLNHMTNAEAIDSTSGYFIPHQAVLRPSSSTTALRVVFNASFKTSSGNSLNDALMSGPTVQRELFDNLIAFRQHIIAFTADLEKMYRRVIVHPDDRKFQLILWRENSDKPALVYQLNTVTYGTGPAAFLATYCLRKIAEEQTNPEVKRAIEEDFYRDDLLSGANSVAEAIQLQTAIHQALMSAKFNLRKYQSNSPELLSNLNSSLLASIPAVSINGSSNASILGLNWDTNLDSFQIKVRKPELGGTQLTKRIVLAEISKIFDPLGFVSPVTIRAKLMLQRIWQEQLSWDQPVSEETGKRFIAYWNELDELEKFSIPRAYSTLTNPTAYELYAFCDASEKAYAAVAYLKTTNQNGVITNFVAAKTRVAPLKSVTIPRLELEAALLLANLVNRIRPILGLKISQIRAFSDSKIVLAWLAKPAETWKMYVTNRVQKISEAVPFERWSYISTKENPADLATRGISAAALVASNLWKRGPEFISEAVDFEINSFHQTELELRKNVHCFSTTVEPDINSQYIEKFSSYLRLIRVFAYVSRFVNACRKKPPGSVTLSAAEMIEGELIVIKAVQCQLYYNDLKRLNQKTLLSKKSNLLPLRPFVDEKGLLRVGGRLKNAPLSLEKKHPIILNTKSHFVALIIRHIHEKYYHAGKSFILAHLRSKFWIVGNLTNLVKKVIRSCVTCIRYRAVTSEQVMGNLPLERVAISRPFTHTGVDFAGPFTVKCIGHRSAIRFKSYIAVFVCFSTKAIHLEVVSQLTTDHFLCSLSRFIARRGKPATISSDNGTNFVGAASYLDLSHTQIQNSTVNDGIHWKFNPPRAPHRGGLWEGAVKSMKYHLNRCTHGQTLTFEQLATISCRIESILNSRPLVTNKQSFLTPGHFLIGDSLIAEPIPIETRVNLARRYEIIQQTITSFWTAWKKDYLSQLQKLSKWRKASPNIRPNTVVLLKNENQKPNEWPMGLVTDVYPDSDGIVRNVAVKIGPNINRRAIQTVVPLPTSDEP